MAGLALAGALFAVGRRARALWVAVTMLAGGWASLILRAEVRRPVFVWTSQPYRSTAFTFPSVPSAAIVLLAGCLLVAAWSLGRRARVIAGAGAAVTALAVGLAWCVGDRHTLLDVVAGWLVGAVVVLTMLTLAPGAEIRGGCRVWRPWRCWCRPAARPPAVPATPVRCASSCRTPAVPASGGAG